jgi:O-methyltransferase
MQAIASLPTGIEDSRALYLDLLKRVLTNWIYGETESYPLQPRTLLQRALAGVFRRWNLQLVHTTTFKPEARQNGSDWPPSAHTMIGLKRLDNLQWCLERILDDDVAGDIIEAGVWRGGASIFMRAVLNAYGVTDRSVWLADSFKGLPPPNPKKYPQDRGDPHHTFTNLAVSVEKVKANFERYGLLDDQVRFLEGWFSDTLPYAPIQGLSLVRLDGDMYESTMDGLRYLYPKLSPGGYLIVDDYGCIPGCRAAVDDYRKDFGITDEIIPIDWTGVYWRRSAS